MLSEEFYKLRVFDSVVVVNINQVDHLLHLLLGQLHLPVVHESQPQLLTGQISAAMA